MSLLLPDIGDKYEVLHKIGEGGMGAVYKVRHRLLDELRVIKVIQPQHARRSNLRERFQREAQAAIRLRHPNIAQVHDFSIDDQGTAYTVMEYIEGLTLKQLLAHGGPPTMDLAVEIAMQALGALSYLHQQGYLHRDVSPDNLMLSRNFDGSLLVKLIDLGLAKRLAGDLDLTSSGMFMGKVRYASPEQFSGAAKEPDARSDLYSFSVVLYELLSGECPIEGASFEEIVASHLIRPVPDLSATGLGSRVPEDLRLVVMAALAKDPTQRVATAADYASSLMPFRGEAVPSFDELAEPYRSVLHELEESALTVQLHRVPETFVSTMPLEEHNRRLEVAEPEGTTPDAKPSRARVWRWVAAGLVTAAVAWLGLTFGWHRPGPATPVPVVIEAVPWAEVQSLADADGLPVPAAVGTFTPAVLSLAPGTYQLTLAHPGFREPRSVAFEVPVTVPPRVEFGIASADEYFTEIGLAAVLEQAGN